MVLAAAAVCALGAGVGSLAGCAGRGARAQPRSTSEQVKPGGLLSRPKLVASATEKYPDPVTGQLDFFDELEERELVSHDDSLHAVLLVMSGSSAPTYVQRVALAKGHGWLEMGFNRPPREAVTVGEVALLVSRSMNGNNIAAPLREADALAELKVKGIFPQGSRPTEGLTGPQLLAVVMLADEASRGRPMAQGAPEAPPPVFADITPVGAAPAPAPEQPPAPAPPGPPPAETRPAVAVTAPAARPEPLPQFPQPTATPAAPVAPAVTPVAPAETPAPGPAPSPPAPSPPAPAPPPPAPSPAPAPKTPEVAPAPAAPPPAVAPKPRWVGGKPLEKKKKKP
jgi:hypothetical protein